MSRGFPTVHSPLPPPTQCLLPHHIQTHTKVNNFSMLRIIFKVLWPLVLQMVVLTDRWIFCCTWNCLCLKMVNSCVNNHQKYQAICSDRSQRVEHFVGTNNVKMRELKHCLSYNTAGHCSGSCSVVIYCRLCSSLTWQGLHQASQEWWTLVRQTNNV